MENNRLTDPFDVYVLRMWEFTRHENENVSALANQIVKHIQPEFNKSELENILKSLENIPDHIGQGNEKTEEFEKSVIRYILNGILNFSK